MDEDILPPQKKKSPLVLAGEDAAGWRPQLHLVWPLCNFYIAHAGAGVTAGVLIAGLMFFNKVRLLVRPLISPSWPT